jgi:hypothetical protein
MRRTAATAVEVEPRGADRYHRWLVSTTEGTAWAVSNEGFRSEPGAIVTQWASSPLVSWLLTRSLGRWSETTTSSPAGDRQPTR